MSQYLDNLFPERMTLRIMKLRSMKRTYQVQIAHVKQVKELCIHT